MTEGKGFKGFKDLFKRKKEEEEPDETPIDLGKLVPIYEHKLTAADHQFKDHKKKHCDYWIKEIISLLSNIDPTMRAKDQSRHVPNTYTSEAEFKFLENLEDLKRELKYLVVYCGPPFHSSFHKELYKHYQK